MLFVALWLVMYTTFCADGDDFLHKLYRNDRGGSGKWNVPHVHRV